MVHAERSTHNQGGLAGRTLYVPQMAYAGGRLIAAAFRSIGIDATITPDSDNETLVLGGLHASGEECLPHKITLGDFLKVCKQPDFDPARTAFFMATSHGPCRFGQYVPYLKKELDRLGYGEVMIFSPSAGNSYDGIREHAGELMRTMWVAVTCGDLVTKFLYKTRPYETVPGAAQAVCAQCVHDFADALSRQGVSFKQRYRHLVGLIEQMRDRFRAVPADYVKGRPLIGIVGEIFCRLNDFANLGALNCIERLGGECWMSEFSEWVWYANWGQQQKVRSQSGRFSLAYLKCKLKAAFQQRYSRGLRAPLVDDLVGYEETHDIGHVLEAARPYLPAEGCLGEMVLSAGQTIFLQEHGADGVIDISPFTCMNGIIAESVYPSISARYEHMPVRICYFDGTNTSVERDLEIFIDLARAYQGRKTRERIYPSYFR